jgi:hypothetical protein
MPEVQKGETGKAYISRCIKQVMGEGKTQKQALGQCYGMLRQKRGNKGLMPKKGK